MNVEPLTASTVVSSADSKNYLRLVENGEEVATLPVRGATERDRAFILSTWVRSYAPGLRKLSEKTSSSSLTRLLSEESKAAETLWERTICVGSPDDEFTVHAWACGSPGRLDYVYVPPELRQKGIAGALIRHLCGHTFEYGRQWPFRKGPSGGSFNPYILGRAG